MADTLYTSQTPVVQNDFDGSSHAWGLKYTVSSDCSLTGGRAWVPAAGRPTTFLWQVWRVGDSTKVAETDLNGAGHGSPSNGAWMSFDSSLFGTPGDVAQDNAETYIVCVAFAGGNGAYTDDGSESFPLSSGGLASASTGRFSNGAGTNVMPASDYAAYFWADVDVETAGATHEGAGTAAATSAASATSTVDRIATGTGAATGASSATATVTREGSGTAAATGASSATSTVDRQAAATAEATGASSATATVDRQAAGSAAATGSASSTATVSRAATGTVTATSSVTATATVDIGGVPAAPTAWRASPPESKWSAGLPESKWQAGRPEGG